MGSDLHYVNGVLYTEEKDVLPTESAGAEMQRQSCDAKKKSGFKVFSKVHHV